MGDKSQVMKWSKLPKGVKATGMKQVGVKQGIPAPAF
jgi:hypothetical protein